jgi:phosphonopyruvate decarboxylase
VIDPKVFLAILESERIRFFTGVPDSLLQPLCAQLMLSIAPERHIIAANEGAAIGLAAGWHLATNSTACVYMQNSGLGNAVNPLVSLADPDVYSIPMLLVIGWRGEMRDGRQIADEPQHVKQGRITPAMLECLEIPYVVLSPDAPDAAQLVTRLARQAGDEGRPTAILVRKGTFGEIVAAVPASDYELSRESALSALLDALPDDAIVVSTTGKLSRELYELRTARGQSGDRDFLTVGSMGHALQIASGIALARPEKRVVCLDGDGAMIMHMGALTTSATISNLMHIVINNGAHESVGGQPTQGFRVDLPLIARACGYAMIRRALTGDQIREAIHAALAAPGSSFVEIRTRVGARENLGRPKTSPVEAKRRFMRSVGATT